MFTPEAARILAETYLQHRGAARIDAALGDGKDGYVWRTTRPSALKIHQQETSYHFERDAYIRLRDLGIKSIGRFTLPTLEGYDDELRAIEMTIVFPPYIVDFASARLDWEPDLIEDEGHTFADMIRERFDEHADEALGLHAQLVSQAGLYLMDMHLGNIKFG